MMSLHPRYDLVAAETTAKGPQRTLPSTSYRDHRPHATALGWSCVALEPPRPSCVFEDPSSAVLTATVLLCRRRRLWMPPSPPPPPRRGPSVTRFASLGAGVEMIYLLVITHVSFLGVW